jgi:hypothetical protein
MSITLNPINLRTVEIGYEVPDLGPGQLEPPRPDGTPDSVKIRWSAPAPVIAERGDLGISLPDDAPVPGGECRHRLVTIGDSLTQGFKSAAISETWRSWPMIVAYELGLRAAYDPGEVVPDPEFTFPAFPGPQLAPGLPINLEWVLRAIEEAVGGTTLRLNEVEIGETAKRVACQVAEYWEQGDGARPLPATGAFHHNLAVWGHDVRDALSRSGEWCAAAMHPLNAHKTFPDGIRTRIFDHLKNDLMVSYPGERSTIRTLWGPDQTATQVSAAKWLGDNGGIETLVVILGANNALGAVTNLKVNWSGDAYQDLARKDAYNVWRPEHFEAEFGALMDAVRDINAKHVIWATVPHVTVVPLARGVGEKPYYSRYFTRYTRPWITDAQFDASTDPCLTGDEARAVDSAIDQYNYFIKSQVRDARQGMNGPARDWYLFDMCGLLDRLAYRRYLNSPRSQPDWFVPYPLPPELLALSPGLDTRFFRADAKGRLAGGLIALDGVHPTTVGYGILAQEIVTIMSTVAKVPFRYQNGMPCEGEKRKGEITVDFSRLIKQDTLISNPPKLLDESLKAIDEINKVMDFTRLLVRKL